jgi:hypothetical protein
LLQEVRRRFKARRQDDDNWIGWFQIAFDQSPRERQDASDLTTRQGISEDSETLLHTAKTMTGEAIAAQLKALADYERRAEKAWLDDAGKALARSAER